MHKLQITALVLIAIALGRPLVGEPVPYPDGFREWVHVKTALIGPESPAHATAGGFHHIYGNAAALRGYATRQFPDGAVLVFDRFDVQTSGGVTREASRLTVDVMVRDSAKFASTGGWGYERFRGDTRDRLVGDRAATACFACHAGRREQGYVFSDLRR